MTILAIDTSMAACSAAILPDAASAPVQRFEPMTRGHAEALLPMVEAVMAETGQGFRDLSAIAVTVGPGSFTGVRAGLAAARGFALAAKLPIIAAASLEVMALGTIRQLSAGKRHKELVVVHDARRNEVYAQLFDANGFALNSPEVLKIGDLVDRLPSSIMLAAGSGAQLLADAAAAQGREIHAVLPHLLPEAADLAMLAATRPSSGRSPKPLYLRSPDAKPQIGKSLARVTE